MATDRELLRRGLHNQQIILRLLLLIIRGEQEIEMSQDDVNAAVAAIGQTTQDLLNMATTTSSRLNDVDVEVKALQAQIATAGVPVDTTALVGAVEALTGAHDTMKAAVQALADDVNVPVAGSGETVDEGNGEPAPEAGV
jgi:hypothetical protein